MLEKEYRKHLVKDFKLPFDLLSDEYWAYYSDVFTDINIKGKEKLIQDVVDDKHFTCANEFYSYSATLREQIITHIQSKAEYQLLTNTEISSKGFQEKKQLYQQDNKEKIFISLDLVKANFNCMKHFNGAIVDHLNYAEFIKQFTKFEYFVESKQLRQVIFGNLNPKKQQTLQRNMMVQVLNLIKNSKLYPYFDDVSATSSDELVLKVRDLSFFRSINALTQQLQELLNELSFSEMIKMSTFTLDVLTAKADTSRELEFYVKKDCYSDKIDIKGVPAWYFPQVWKFLHNKPLHAYDLDFFFQENICTFKHALTLQTLT